jgi:phage shock protein PspC (stress-responsive transcriptional regulator)
VTNDEMHRAPISRPRLERSRQDRVVGGVCAGIAYSLGLDSALLRIAAVVLALVSGGTAALAYLAAWILIPQATDDRPPARRGAADDGSAREAWSAAGRELRSLAEGLRAARPAPDTDALREHSRAPAIDAAITELGDRLRDPEVRSGARRTANSLSTAVGASVGELRGRRNPPAANDEPVR